MLTAPGVVHTCVCSPAPPLSSLPALEWGAPGRGGGGRTAAAWAGDVPARACTPPPRGVSSVGGLEDDAIAFSLLGAVLAWNLGGVRCVVQWQPSGARR